MPSYTVRVKSRGGQRYNRISKYKPNDCLTPQEYSALGMLVAGTCRLSTSEFQGAQHACLRIKLLAAVLLGAAVGIYTTGLIAAARIVSALFLLGLLAIVPCLGLPLFVSRLVVWRLLQPGPEFEAGLPAVAGDKTTWAVSILHEELWITFHSD